ncbi:hypothetical protein SAMN02745244_03101 [Tessaracoccus bendigoensis DSM 12906]|uniref:Uncharacterized protein n=1 Tax=Tessaracoccus bendigoensis DSM 12906 TaxID=1123357 RepID=A0A1M6LK85_9ACTN|nr:hypothetical protein [Tessaracoccus bendigoensis]SHJ71614.1 hypothetical protein SAMN02745244_03101 [Tessaracoccus bendigoensis DSM 12906]
MIWIVVFGVLAFAGGIVAVLYASSLTHKVSDIRHEVGIARERVGRIGALLGGVELPSSKRG